MASDPHTDDLADRLSYWSTTPYTGPNVARDLRAAAAELRRLRQRDAALTRLLDAVGDARNLCVDFDEPRLILYSDYLRRIAAAVEDIDRPERPPVCPTCGSDNPLIAGGRRTEPCPDPWHGGAE